MCGFNFVEAYGEWGRGFAEVHHLVDLSGAPKDGLATDPERDLAVVCSNCHRMIHRRNRRALTLEELRTMMQASSGLTDL